MKAVKPYITFLIFFSMTNTILAQKSVEIKVRKDDIAGEFVLVKGGEFTMGCTEDQKEDCKNKSNFSETQSSKMLAKVNSFYLGKTEVTQKQWMSIMGSNPSFHNCPDCPVENIDHADIDYFLKKLNAKSKYTYRLPTLIEWEYAARGGRLDKPSMYPGSDNLDELAWYSKNSADSTHEVGLKKPNELGLFDMAGNVYEFCSSIKPDNPLKDYDLIKGGSYLSTGSCKVGYLHAIFYFDLQPPSNNKYTGFRLLMEMKKN